MIPIFIASAKNYSGKTFVALGLAMKLAELGYKVGYLKPLGKTPVKKGKDVFDADAVFIKETLSLREALDVMSPFVVDYEKQNLLFLGKIKGIKKQIMAAFKSQKNKDFVIIGGAADIFDGALLGVSGFSLIEDMNAQALVVESWAGDASADSLFGLSKMFGKRFLGGVLNKVPVNSMQHVKDTVRPFLEKEGVQILGVLRKDSVLESFTVRQLVEVLNGTVLCCEDRLEESVENFSIGAMDVDSALSYFRRTPNKAVITGAYRSDIQLAAMETSTKCIILTGGLYTNDVVIGKAQSKGIPIISVTADTFTVVDKIEAIMGKTRLRGEEKIKRVKELFDKEFDMKRFLKAVKK